MNLPIGIGLSEIEMKISQDSDSCDSNDLGQELILKTQAPGDGKYLIIETKRWAISDEKEVDAFAGILKQFIVENR